VGPLSRSLPAIGNADRLNQIQRWVEDDMRKIITAVVVVIVAAITTAWSVSTSKPSVASKTEKAIVGDSAARMRTFPLW
jgi:hypothetical protein